MLSIGTPAVRSSLTAFWAAASELNTPTTVVVMEVLLLRARVWQIPAAPLPFHSSNPQRIGLFSGFIYSKRCATSFGRAQSG
jgi:hypothetical protein